MKNPKDIIPYGRQQISDDDVKAVTDVLKSDFLTQGRKVGEFEKLVSKISKAQKVQRGRHI